jgi:hypothetical protein
MAKRKSFGDLPKDARDRAARIGKRNFDLTRRQVRERYNRGTYNPYARDPATRVPVEFRAYRSAGTSYIDWQEAALDNLRKTYEDYFKVNDDTLVYNAFHMSDDMARLTATSDEDQLTAWASIQSKADGSPPDLETLREQGLPDWVTVEDIGVMINDEWYNLFWYH